MFDDNNIDKMMKSILDNGQEEVPAHVWEGISAGLDKAAKRKAVVIWWRRAAIGTAAAAAIFAGILFTRNSVTTSVQQNQSQLAVLDEEVVDIIDVVPAETTTETLICQAPAIAQHTPKATRHHVESAESPVIIEEPAALTQEPAAEQAVTVKQAKTVEQTKVTEQTTDFEAEHPSEVRKPVRTSLILSGVTSTNNAQTAGRASIMKRPSLVAKPIQTGVTEAGTNTIYGIPVSAGVGVKIEFNDKWSLGAGVNYTFLTSRFNGTYTQAENRVEINSIKSDIRNTQHYIGIPVNVYYKIIGNRNLNFYTYIGGTVERCISNKYNILSTGLIHKESPAGVQLSANAGIGVEFLLGQHLGLYVDPSLRYYFDNDQPKSIRTSQPMNLGLEVGLRINL